MTQQEREERGNGGALLGKADLHLHSSVSDGMASVAQILEYVEHETDLDLVAITDHDQIEGSWEARELWAKGRYRFEVIVGTEVTTLQGHLLCLFVEKPLRSLQPLEKTIEAVHRQGGLCIVPHPMSWLTRSVSRGALERILRDGRGGIYFDGIEASNGTIAGRVVEKKTRELNSRVFHLPETGGSDAHFLGLIGGAYTTFEGKGAADFRRSLLSGATGSYRDRSINMSKVGYDEIAGQQVRSLVLLPSKHIRRVVRRWISGGKTA